MTRYVPDIRALVEHGSWLAVFLAIFYMAVTAMFVRHVGVVLRALLAERDPEQRRILHDVLRDLLEVFRHGRRR